MGNCDHCGLTLKGFGTVTRPDGTVAKLCHTNAIGRPDCYRRVTLYKEPLGFLKDVKPPLPEGVSKTIDPVAGVLNELWETFGDTPVTVCMTHKRFVPCRKNNDSCVLSVKDED